jgi:endoribonuclease Dicer
MLIKYVLSEEYRLIRKRAANAPSTVSPTEPNSSDTSTKEKQAVTDKPLVMFIVNHLTLVHQQATFIQRNTPYSVGEYHGNMGIDLGDKSTWKKEIDEHDVMVMTAQILRNILLHAFISMEQIAMIVIDECHHSKAHHPYNEIMKEFYWPTPKHQRPKIFAMTASPLDSKDNVGASAS